VQALTVTRRRPLDSERSMLRLLVGVFFGVLASSHGAVAQSCSGSPWTVLSNGNPADATQVMDNFNCVLKNPNFSGIVSVGTTSPVTSLAVTGQSYMERATAGTPADVLTLSVTGPNYAQFFDVGQTGSAGGLGIGGTNTITGIPSSSIMFWNTNTGNVGIGTASPVRPLVVNGNNGGGQIGVSNTANTSTVGGLGISGANGQILAGDATGDLDFWVNGSSNRMNFSANSGASIQLSIAHSGNVGIGTATPAQALEVNGQIKVDSLASASGTALCINASVISSCSSSRRYKENIHSADFGLKEIDAMRSVTFKWKGRDEQDFGLIAEEVAKIDPRFVTYKAGKIEGVKYPQLTAVLVNAVKQLKSANDRQASEINQLRAQTEAALEHMRSRLGALENRSVIHTAENLAVVHGSATK